MPNHHQKYTLQTIVSHQKKSYCHTEIISGPLRRIKSNGVVMRVTTDLMLYLSARWEPSYIWQYFCSHRYVIDGLL